MANWLAWYTVDAIGWVNQPWTPGFGAMRYGLVASIEGSVSALGTGLALIWFLRGETNNT